MNTICKKGFLTNSLLKFGSVNKSLRMFCTNKTSDQNNIINLSKPEEFDKIVSSSDIPVLVDFYADWCGPCKRLTPLLEQKQKEKNNFKLVKVNVDNHPELSERFNVQGIPHVVLFKNGKKDSEFVGLNEKALNNMVASF